MLLSKLYVHGSYEFALVEKLDLNDDVNDVGQSYSQFSVESGYFIGEKLTVSLSLDGLLYHGGEQFADWFEFTADQKLYHDLILRGQALFASPKAGYQLSQQLSGSLGFRTFLWGHNTRKSYAVLASLGFSWDGPG